MRENDRSSLKLKSEAGMCYYLTTKDALKGFNIECHENLH